MSLPKLWLLISLCRAASGESVLIVLRQPEGPVGQRLATLPAATAVPEEIRVAAERERVGMAQTQQRSFHSRLTAAGATAVVPYPALNMIRAEIPAGAQAALRSDPAVVSVTPFTEGDPVPQMMTSGLGVGGVAPGMAVGMGTLPAAGPGMMPVGGGMWQSLLGVTGQVGAQTAIMMPRTAGIMVLLSGGAQIAQAIAANRKQSCSIALDSTSKKAPAGGGTGVLVVRASPSCLWIAQSDAEWLKVEGEGPMVGSAVVRYTVAAGQRRMGVITIAGIAKGTVKGATSLKVVQE